MPERLTSSAIGVDNDREHQCSLSATQAKEDWGHTVDNLMVLAKRANKSFDGDIHNDVSYCRHEQKQSVFIIETVCKVDDYTEAR